MRNRLVCLFMTLVMVASLLQFKITANAASFSDARVVENGKTVTQSFGYSANEQYLYYKFDVPATGLVKIKLHAEELKYGYFYFYDSQNLYDDFQAYYCSTDYDTKVWNSTSFEKILTPGTYYIVYNNRGTRKYNGDYLYSSGSVSVTYNYTNLNVTSSIDRDGNDSIPNASSWDCKATPTFTGALSFHIEDENDFYRFSVPQNSEYHFRFVASRAYTVRFYDDSGNDLKSYYASYNDAYGKNIVDKNVSFTGGVYYVGILASSPGYYTMTLEPIASGSSNSASGGSNSSGSSAPKYKNEWRDGRWYDSNGNQSYSGRLKWKHNSKGWWVEDTAGWYPRSKWQKIDGVWYYFNSSGYMASDEWYDGYWFNSNGSWTYPSRGSWHSSGRGWWYGDSSGWYARNQWQKIDGYWYYFDGSGYMATSQYIGGWWVGADGVCR
ncbi:MAG: hypothetical protein K6F60_01900 [Eubacterium sp.]|nr:hypothetical protein [Eubacterium sp.]